jgi:hypothetical protein
MIAVAALAVMLGAVTWILKMRARSAAYHRRAFEFDTFTWHAGSTTETPDGRRVALWDDENTRREDDWAWRMEAKYLRLSYYPWLDPEPDPPPPEPLPHPRSPFELPERRHFEELSVQDSHPPAWTYLWTWRPGSSPWE